MSLLNTSNVTIENINTIVNSSNIVDIGIRANWIIYDGYMYFILLLMLSAFIYIKAQSIEDQPLKNAMDSATIVSIIVIIYRGIQITIEGSLYPLLTDHQMWIFPVVAICLALVNYMTKKD